MANQPALKDARPTAGVDDLFTGGATGRVGAVLHGHDRVVLDHDAGRRQHRVRHDHAPAGQNQTLHDTSRKTSPEEDLTLDPSPTLTTSPPLSHPL